MKYTQKYHQILNKAFNLTGKKLDGMIYGKSEFLINTFMVHVVWEILHGWLLNSTVTDDFTTNLQTHHYKVTKVWGLLLALPELLEQATFAGQICFKCLVTCGHSRYVKSMEYILSIVKNLLLYMLV